MEFECHSKIIPYNDSVFFLISNDIIDNRSRTYGVFML
jgi:hypothetical protein